MAGISSWSEHACIRFIERHVRDLCPGLCVIGHDEYGRPIYDKPAREAIDQARARLDAAGPSARRMSIHQHGGRLFFLPGEDVYCFASDNHGHWHGVTVLPRNTSISGVRIYLVTPDDIEAMVTAGVIQSESTASPRFPNRAPAHHARHAYSR